MNPTLQSGGFRYNENIRRHLQKNISSIDCAVETDRERGVPYTLVVQKHLEEYISQKRRWTETVQRVKKQIKELLSKYSNDAMQVEYNLFIRILRNAAATNPSGAIQAGPSLHPVPAAAQNSRIVPPVAGVKRKAQDVVDLSGDASDTAKPRYQH
jgi:hypothetical protein